MPLRVTEREEALGLDVTQHGEEAYVTGEGAILVTPDGGSSPTCRWLNRPSVLRPTSSLTRRAGLEAPVSGDAPCGGSQREDDRRMT